MLDTGKILLIMNEYSFNYKICNGGLILIIKLKEMVSINVYLKLQ